MTLQEKFDKISCKDCDMPFCDNKCTMLSDGELNILEQIAEEFAIGFADWCKQEYELEDTAFHNKWLDVDGTYVSSKQLLEIYKKEKGL